MRRCVIDSEILYNLSSDLFISIFSNCSSLFRSWILVLGFYSSNMIRTTLFVVALFSSFFSIAQLVNKVSDPVEWVNPLMGTDSKGSLSNGNTYPAICVPWGMNFWVPQTNVMGNGWQYQYSADKIRGFKQTHQPSPWMNDYGQFSIMPVTKKLVFRQDDRASWFSHKTEIVKPYYYRYTWQMPMLLRKSPQLKEQPSSDSPSLALIARLL